MKIFITICLLSDLEGSANWSKRRGLGSPLPTEFITNRNRIESEPKADDVGPSVYSWKSKVRAGSERWLGQRSRRGLFWMLSPSNDEPLGAAYGDIGGQSAADLVVRKLDRRSLHSRLDVFSAAHPRKGAKAA